MGTESADIDAKPGCLASDKEVGVLDVARELS